MKIKAGRGKHALSYGGKRYPVDAEGYCDIPQAIAIRAGFIPPGGAPEASPIEDSSEEQASLVRTAHELGLGAPSTLKRWSIERLRGEIEQAQAGNGG